LVEHLPEPVRPSVRRALRDAWASRGATLALRQLERLARSLSREHPGVASSLAHHTRNVRRWRDGPMRLRWIGAALHEATRGFRRVRGHRDLLKPCTAFERAHAARTVAVERKVA
jgi:hypothetical protein